MDEPLETEHADIRESVRARCAAAATRFAGGEHAQARAVEASCCGAAPVATTDHGDAVVFGAVLYNSDDGAGAPEAAVAASLGCGVPTAVADLHSGEIVINLAADKPTVLREATRVLRPGGRFAVSDVIAGSDMDDATRADMQQWTGCIAGALTRRQFEHALSDAGLVDVQITETHRVHEHARAAIVRARRPTAPGH